MRKRKLVIPRTLPGLNEYITAERTSKYKGAAMKRTSQQLVVACAKQQLRGFHPERVTMRYKFYERDRRRDKDNISSFARKVIQDGLVAAGTIKNDGWGEIESYDDKFFVDKKCPRIEIEIEEIEGE